MADTTAPGTDIPARAWAELLLLSLIWGAVFFSVAIALREIGPMTSVLHRVGWAALLLWIIVAARKLPVPREARVWGAFLVMGALNNVIPFALMSWGQIQIGTGLTAIFNGMTAPFAVLVAAVFLRDEPLSARRLTGVLLGFVGVVVIKGPANLFALDPQALGTYAVLIGALSYAFAGAWAKRTLPDQPPMVAAAGMLTGSTLLMIPLAVLTDGMPTRALAPATWTAIAYYSVIGTAGAYLLYYRVLAMAGSGNLLLCTLIIPPTAILLGVAFLGESMTAQTLGGFALIAAGLAVIDGRVLRLLRRTSPG
ncbi:MAG: DMT family transporter [Paracoccaceae bacterium]|nr:DMT family transporter [Paracoccaceae bacterium]